jgi:hypothetical protein
LQKQLSIIKVCGTFESGTSEKSEDEQIKKLGKISLVNVKSHLRRKGCI